MSYKHTKGFTIIELLVAIAIIGILVAVLTPSLLNAKRTSTDRASIAFARNMVQWVASVLTTDQTMQVTDLATTCTDAMYISEGAPSTLPPFITDCEILIEPNGGGTSGARVTASTGAVLEIYY